MGVHFLLQFTIFSQAKTKIMRYIEEDDCYCPHGVVERTETSIKAVWYFVLAFVGVTILQAVVSAVKYVFNALGRAARGLMEVVDIVGWSVLCVVSFIILALYVHDKVMNYIERKELPWFVSIFVKLRKVIRGHFYRRDLQKRFDERPELSLLTVDDIIRDMNDGHHEGEEQLTKEEWGIYLEQFYKIKDERGGKERAAKCDARTISHN